MAERGRRWRAWRQPGSWSLTGYTSPDPAGPRPSGELRVVLVDDSAEVRTLVRTKLRLSGAAVVEGEGADGTDAVDLARRLQPDAMLLDVSMPGLDGLAALPQVLEASPNTRVVMFSGFDEEPLALRALELGASSYLTKTSSLEDVVAELVGAVTGEEMESPPGRPRHATRRGRRQPGARGAGRALPERLRRRCHRHGHDDAPGPHRAGERRPVPDRRAGRRGAAGHVVRRQRR